MQPRDYFTQLEELIHIPPVPVTLDFETFYDTSSDYSLRKMSIEEYVRDPRFLVHGLSVKLGDKPAHWIAGADRVAEFLQRIPLRKSLCIAHNARFDGFILSEVYGVQPYMWADTMAMAAMVCGTDLPSASLKNLAKRFLPKELQKDATALVNVDGKAVLSKAEMKALGEYAVMDSEMAHALYVIFAEILQARPLELPLSDMITRMFTDPRLSLDIDLLEQINETELQEKAAAVAACIAPDITALRSNEQLATLLQGCGVEPPTKLNPKGEVTYAFAKTDREFVELTMHPDKAVRDLVVARLRVKSSIEETRAASYLAVGKRGTWPVALNMSGARVTHRLTGTADGGGNPQNLSNMDKSRLRLAVLPPPDHHLLIIDSSGIDLRCAMTLAGETDVTEQWGTPGFDLYRTFAAYLFNIPLSEVTYAQRKLGKVAVLMLQYKAGGDTFRMMAWSKGVELSKEEAHAVVLKYRQAFPRIAKAWETLDYVLRRLVRGEVENTWMDRLVKANPRTVTGQPGFDVAGGMSIVYPRLSFEYNTQVGKTALMYTSYERDGEGGHGTAGATRKFLHGGKAFGHICQNAARNIVLPQTLAVERWLRAEVDPNCRAVMSVHDEGGYVIPNVAFRNTTPEAVLEGALEIMRTPPSWWPEIRLNAEGGIGEGAYGEVKK